MPAPIASSLQSYRRQNLLTEFASLKHVQPQGIYVSLTPGDASLWSGVLFVREGPYSPAILRFRIHFPRSYPHTAPLVTFNADVFHPLLFDATRSSQNSGSAFDDGAERPPPGALNIRHGFPCWRNKTAANPAPRSPNVFPSQEDSTLPQNKANSAMVLDSQEDDPLDPDDIYVVDILRYMRAIFEDAALLDNLPFDEAANQSAWYAWRASKHSVHAKNAARASTAPAVTKSANSEPPTTSITPAEAGDINSPSTPAKTTRTTAMSLATPTTPKPTPKKPSEWKWEGVWDMRARKGIEASIAEASLYGAGGLRNDEIHFVSVEADEVERMRGELHSHLREA